jgi:pSer/pThr/pTyr-binding forkhead associated (FHA) protein
MTAAPILTGEILRHPMPALRTSNPQPAQPAPTPLLVPVGPHQGRQPLTLGRTVTLIGSTASCRLYLPSKAVSRCHAVVVNTGAGLFVKDLASRTGTRVNGQPVEEADLREGDVLQVGTFTFRFTDPTAPPVKPPTLPGPTAVLEVEELDQPLQLPGRAALIGRRETADVSLTENSASSAHALLFDFEGRHVLRDLNSRTGTLVNGVKIHEHTLESGDLFKVGDTTFRYVRKGAAAPEDGKRSQPAAPEANQQPETLPADVAPSPSPPDNGQAAAEDVNLTGNGVGLLEMGEATRDTVPPSPEPPRSSADAEGDDDGIPLAPAEPVD